MSKLDWKSVTREHVIKAIELFLEEQPKCPSARSTFLMYRGKKLPAKHIRGMAYKIAHNQEISKEDYSGGMETVRFFERLGFEIEYVGNISKAKTIKKDICEYSNSEAKIERVTNKEKGLCVENKSVPDQKLKIPTKHVIEQKNALQLILNKMFHGDIVCEKTYPWMKTPDKIAGEYIEIYNALANYRGNREFAKKNVVLRCDFVCENKKLIS